MTHITYVTGDASRPTVTPGIMNMIVHVCNNAGAWGAGFVLALSREYPEAEAAYKTWARIGRHSCATGPFRLGEYQIVLTRDQDVFVCNLIGQAAPSRSKKNPPVRYEAIRQGLRALALNIQDSAMPAMIHAPKFGAGLAGGDWNVIAGIIQEELCDRDIPVTIYWYDRPAPSTRSTQKPAQPRKRAK
jgi:O-acetyl-ADP-ribose deacetylase (regulator of RNase III)